MSTSDGSVVGATKVVDNGPDSARWVVAIIGEGYQSAELSAFATDAQGFITALNGAAPFDALWPGVNVYRIDVASTDSGAADPEACGGPGGQSPHTYFDATYCSSGTIRRLLTVNNTTALSVATTLVPAVRMTFVIVNSMVYGGSGGPIAVFSKGSAGGIAASEIGIHEMGHTAFGLADEYSTYAGCSSGEQGHDRFAGAEPVQPNITANNDPNTIKWKALVSSGCSVPTTTNQDCSQCDSQANPVSGSMVGAYEGAGYFHCSMFRPQFDCRMRDLGNPFCAVCANAISSTIGPYLPQ